MCDGQPSNSVEPAALHGIFRLAPAGWPSVPPLTVGLTAVAFVNRSGSGLPFASVSKGTLAGMLVPRRRMYCDAFTFSILNVITLNSLSCLSAAQVRSLNVYGEKLAPEGSRTTIATETFEPGDTTSFSPIVTQPSRSTAVLSCAASTAADSADDSLWPWPTQATKARRSISWPEAEKAL